MNTGYSMRNGRARYINFGNQKSLHKIYARQRFKFCGNGFFGRREHNELYVIE